MTIWERQCYLTSTHYADRKTSRDDDGILFISSCRSFNLSVRIIPWQEYNLNFAINFAHKFDKENTPLPCDFIIIHFDVILFCFLFNYCFSAAIYYGVPTVSRGLFLSDYIDMHMYINERILILMYVWKISACSILPKLFTCVCCATNAIPQNENYMISQASRETMYVFVAN